MCCIVSRWKQRGKDTEMGVGGVAILIRVMGEVGFEQKSGGDAGKESSMCR